MTKYVIISWPEVKYFLDNERWSECIFCKNVKDHPVKEGSWAIPEDLYDKVTYKLQFPKKFENTNLGTIICYENYAVVNGADYYYYDESNIKRGNEALIYNYDDKKYYICKIVACGLNLPILLDKDKFFIGLNCELIGHRNPDDF